MADALMAPYTRIRERVSEADPIVLDSLGLSGRVCMGTSRVNTGHGDAHVVRFAATTNEDLYRIFHHCLLPLHSQFGIQFYKDRIRAKASEIPRMANQEGSGLVEKDASILTVHAPASPPAAITIKDEPSAPIETDTMWAAYMMADSALPTGSFAHSAGLEVAAQIGVLSDTRQLETFIQAAVRSSVQATAPFLVRGHELGTNIDEDAWVLLDRQCQAALAPNALACAASIDQGKSLARVAEQWLDMNDAENQALITCFGKGSHIGPVVGGLGARLGLSTEQVGHLFGYCVGRDMVSSAVRLSLVGPLASVKSLKKVQKAAKDGWKSYQVQALLHADGDPLAISAASAPIIEAVHPCHEALQVRLFRT
jgi:urease accessory protein